jgi:hypothetical protein
MLDLKIAFVIVGLIIAFGIFFYNPMVYHARMLKLRKEVEDLRKAVKILALQVDLQMLINKVRNSEETEKVPEEPKEQPKD